AGTGSEDFNGWMDEMRVVKGEYLPPRFYFGTNYGDQDGGTLPQRATSAHRFADDERTVVLVSGQSANNHALSVSLVDESGFHADNVHFSNSSVSTYPTQDSVGQQFTISGPQQTTKESFIGNTSSIVLDGYDDALQIAHSTDLQTGTGDFQIDFWINQNDVTDPPSDIYLFDKGCFGSSDVDGYVLRFSSASGAQTIQFYYRVSSTNYLAFTAPNSGISDNTWAHLAMVRSGGTNYCFVDGKMLASATTGGTLDAGSTYASRIGSPYGGTGNNKFVNGYIDEIRFIKGSVDKPQIKWTHTQTAGAGNKDAYDVHGWRAHGHEFTDDNATSLLVHGDAYDTTSDAAVGIFKDSSSANSIH
ncbi:MAG: LamG domain-containing protein, partial [Candidatus Pacebacteria bacterium]|nr:LamG domain-containing protein [Candidatus Paceibacterota bacterium]